MKYKKRSTLIFTAVILAGLITLLLNGRIQFQPVVAANHLPTANLSDKELVDSALITQTKKLTKIGGFGVSVSISGDLAVVGAFLDSNGGSSSGAAYIYERNLGGLANWGEVKKLVPSDPDLSDHFGKSVSISGNTVIIGSPLDDDGGTESGSAYVFEKNEGGTNNWGQVKKIVSSDPAANDDFGNSVAISDDIIVIGEESDSAGGASSGAAHIYYRNTGGTNNWGHLKKIVASDPAAVDKFGTSVSISGNNLIIGSPSDDDGAVNSGSAYIFNQNFGGAENWGEVKKLVASDAGAQDSFGSSVSISGNNVAVGASLNDDAGTDSGSAYVFSRNAGGSNNWGEVKKIVADDASLTDNFGVSVAISNEAVIVGAENDDEGGLDCGAAYVFNRDEGGVNNWGQISKLIPNDAGPLLSFGAAAAISENSLLVGAPNARAYIFERAPSFANTKAWGSNYAGQLGVGNNIDQATPVSLPTIFDTSGASSGFHTLFLRADGTVVASGLNSFGALGDGTMISQQLPQMVPGLSNIVQVSTGSLLSVVLDSSGNVWAWGRNQIGEIGNGTTNPTGCLCVLNPTQSSISDVVKIAVGDRHTLALTSDGTVWGWGQNVRGQLGDNTNSPKPSPIQVGVGVSGFNDLIAISASLENSIALKSDGTVWVWGSNDFGQIGNGTVGGFDIDQPQLVPNLNNIVQISAGEEFYTALRGDGKVFVWGKNDFGQVGNGTSGGNQSVPVLNTSLINIVDIKSGKGHNIARRKDGLIVSWGKNDLGQLGTGTIATTGCMCQTTPTAASAGNGNAGIGIGTETAFTINPFINVVAGGSRNYYGDYLSFSYPTVNTAGELSFSAVDPATLGIAAPNGYMIQNKLPAYDISSTSNVSGAVTVCFENIPVFDQTLFNKLYILHDDDTDGTFDVGDVTRDYRQRQICRTTTTFSPFVLAESLAPTAASVNVSGRVSLANGRGISRASVQFFDSEGSIRTAMTNHFGYFNFENVDVGQTYVFEVFAKSYLFAPQVITVQDNISGLNFSPIGKGQMQTETKEDSDNLPTTKMK